MGIYGPRTVFCLAVAGYPGCHEFLLMDDGKWVHVKETTGGQEEGREGGWEMCCFPGHVVSAGV